MKKRRTPLFPSFSGSVRNPKAIHGLDRIVVSSEQREFMESESLDLFTIASNAGMPFREALSVVFLSGMNAAHTVRPNKDDHQL